MSAERNNSIATPQARPPKKLTAGILAHVDAGKTTLSEALLYRAGMLRKLGRVDHRDTFLDTHALERERGITIFSKQARIRTDALELTLLDTPGHADLSGETERAIAAMDVAILVVSGTDGVQAHTETLWSLLLRARVPTFLFVTKMDAAKQTRDELLEDLRTSFGEGCLELPAADEEALAMLDDAALEAYMTAGRVSDDEIVRLIRTRKLFPVCFGSGLRLDGVDGFLSLLTKYAPEPPRPAIFGARVYKIGRDPQAGRLTYMKLTGGTLSVRDTLRYRGLSGEIVEEKAAQLRLYSGAKFETAQSVSAGDVVAVTGLTETRPGQGLGAEPDGETPLLTPALGYRIGLPAGVDPRAVLPKLRQLEEEEPLLHIAWQPNLGEIQAQLMGPLQTDVLVSLVRERFDLDVTVGTGRILYRETIAAPVEGVGHFEPLRHYAEVHLLLEPGEPGSGLSFASAVSEDDLDLNWQRLILTHLAEKEHLGVLTGSPLTDVKITLIAGRAHLKHTEGGDFRQATYRAVRQGLMQAQSVLLEPYYRFRLEVPISDVGRAISDIQAMGGVHDAPEEAGGRMVLTGSAPVSAMAEYMTEVAAYTQGRGRFSCRVEGYRPCKNAEAVIAERAYDPESDLDNTPDSVFCAHGAGIVVKWRDVREYMHLDTGFGKAAPSSDPQVKVRRKNLDLDEKELAAIMEREFGPVRQNLYIPPRTVSAAPLPALAQKAPERILVDGYNVIFAWDELKALADRNLDLARGKLIDILINYQSYTASEVVLVFDAYKVPSGVGMKYTEGPLHVVYTKENETADMYIERLVDEIGKNEAVRVVTSDSLVRLGALRSGVLRTSSREFQGEVERVLEKIAGSVQRNQQTAWKIESLQSASTIFPTGPNGGASSPERDS